MVRFESPQSLSKSSTKHSCEQREAVTLYLHKWLNRHQCVPGHSLRAMKPGIADRTPYLRAA